MAIDGDELQRITADGLQVGGTLCAGPIVDGVTLDHTQHITEVVTLVASLDGATGVFSGSPSTFRSLSTQADDGWHFRADVTTSNDFFYIDGDLDDAIGNDNWNKIGFTDQRTVSAAGTLTLVASQQGITPVGALTLEAAKGIVVSSKVTSSASANKPLVMNADTGPAGDGNVNIKSGLVSTNDNTLTLTCYDLDIGIGLTPGTIDAGTGSIELYPSKDSQTVGLGVASMDMTLSNTKLGSITASGLSLGSAKNADIYVQGVTDAAVSAMALVTLLASRSGSTISFASKQSTFSALSAQVLPLDLQCCCPLPHQPVSSAPTACRSAAFRISDPRVPHRHPDRVFISLAIKLVEEHPSRACCLHTDRNNV